MSTIAIVGAGPGLGMAIARAFGRNGFDVALISRSRDKLSGYVAALASEGITSAGFTADVLDRDSLQGALHQAAARFGAIDVLEYSPVGGFEGTRFTMPSQTEPADVDHELRFQLYGAMAAVQAVLPGMRERGAGSLLFTTGAGSVDPVPFIANINAAAAALRNWVVNLNKELAGTGVYAAHVAIDASIDGAVPDYPAASADEIAATYWQLHNSRDVAEKVFRP